MTFKLAGWDSTQIGKKGPGGERPNGETEKGIPQHIQKKVNNTGTFKEIKVERRKE